MDFQTPRTDSFRVAMADETLRQDCAPAPGAGVRDLDVERAATFVLDDCLFALGQAVGTRTTLEYDALVWIRQHFHARFVRAILAFGNRWAEDRETVTGAAFMLAERAVRYAADRPAIDVDAIRQASADVERFCMLHSRRAAKARGLGPAATDMPLIAGYWCVPGAPPQSNSTDE